jgi:hypothetical protein
MLFGHSRPRVGVDSLRITHKSSISKHHYPYRLTPRLPSGSLLRTADLPLANIHPSNLTAHLFTLFRP